MEPDDTNEHTQRLEKAMELAGESPSMFAIMFRALLRAPLYFLMPASPEMVDGEVQIPVSETPPFIMFKNVEHDRHEVALFTSMARFEEYQATRTVRKSYAVACGDGRTILALIARTNKPIVVNPTSPITKSLFMPAAQIVALLDGTMLAPLPLFIPPHPKRKPGEIAQIQPCTLEDLPPRILDPVIEFIQKSPEITTAWLVKELHPDQPTKARLLIVIETKGDAQFAEENFGFVVRFATHEHLDCVPCKLDPKSPDGKMLIEKQQPFYPIPKRPKAAKSTTRKR